MELLLVAGDLGLDHYSCLPRLVNHILRWVLGFQNIGVRVETASKMDVNVLFSISPLCQGRLDNSFIFCSLLDPSSGEIC